MNIFKYLHNSQFSVCWVPSPIFSDWSMATSVPCITFALPPLYPASPGGRDYWCALKLGQHPTSKGSTCSMQEALGKVAWTIPNRRGPVYWTEPGEMSYEGHWRVQVPSKLSAATAVILPSSNFLSPPCLLYPPKPWIPIVLIQQVVYVFVYHS